MILLGTLPGRFIVVAWLLFLCSSFFFLSLRMIYYTDSLELELDDTRHEKYKKYIVCHGDKRASLLESLLMLLYVREKIPFSFWRKLWGEQESELCNIMRIN